MPRPIHDDLTSIVLSLTIYGFGMGMVEVFLPLLLLQHGAALWQVCSFYVVYSLCKLAVNFPTALIINRWGARLGMMLAVLSSAAQLLLLDGYVSGVAPIAIVAVPACTAAMNSFLWNSQHLHISRVMDERRTSRDMAFMQSVQRVIGILAPLAGGLVGMWLGSAWLVTVALGIVLVSIAPLRTMDALAGGHRRVTRVHYGLRHAHWRDVVANAGFNVQGAVATMVWPVYLAVNIGRLDSVGAMASGSGLIAFALLFRAGRRGDRGRNRRVLLESTALLSATHLARLLAHGVVAVAAVSAAAQTVLSYQFIPWVSIYYAHSRRGGIDYIMSMEIAGDLATLSLWLGLAIVAYVDRGTTFFPASFVIAAATACLCLLVTRQAQVPPNAPTAVGVDVERPSATV